jgi:recombination protein RecA
MYPDEVPVVIDVEGTWDASWGQKTGVDLDRVYLAKPDTGEQAVDMASAFAQTKETSLVIVDSLAALTPMKELEISAEDQTMGIQARLIGNMIRRLTSALITERKRGHFVTVLFINQFRSKVGFVLGDPRSIPGGKALEFCTSVQIEIKNKENMGKDANDVDAVEYNTHSFNIKKNKMNGGLRTGEFELRRLPLEKYSLEQGDIDDVETMLSYAKKFNVYTGGGSSWRLAFNDYDYAFKGMEKAVEMVYSDGDIRWALRNYLIQQQAISLGMPQEFIERFNP